MKPLILLFLLMLTVSMLKAQHTGVYRGQVLDSATHQPVGYVTIILAQISKPEQKKLTKGDGSFLFENLSSGNYQLTLVALGYRPLRTGFHFSAELPNVVPITFLISNKGYTLNEVTIKSAIPLVRQEPDKMIYDIQSDPDSKTDNMLQMMQKVPFLTLDGEDRLLLKGSTDFKVLIDGRSTGMMARNANDALRMLRASTIKQVEVITVSSAKYDSEGAAGIINIITRKNLAGLMSYNLLHANTRIGRGFESSVTAKKDRLGLYVWSGYWNHDLNANRINNLRSNFGPASLSVRQEGWNKSDGFDFPVIAELSYEIDSLNLLNASISTTKDVVHNSGEQLFTAIDQASATQYRFNLDNINTTSVNSYDIGLNYQLGFRNKKNTLLTLAYKFSRSANEFKDESAYLGLSNYPDQQLLQENKYGTDEHTIQLDFSGSISKVKFETGAKLIMRDYFSTDNYNMSGAPVGLINDELTYQQHILGLYHSYRYNYKKWGLSAGLRLEQTLIGANFISNGTLLDKTFLNLIPSTSISYRISTAWNSSLAYTQRIQRPAIWQLNPFVNQNNPLYYTFGNPELRPALFHVAEIGLSRFKKTSYAFNVSYTFARNTIQSIAYLGADQITRASYENIGKSDQFAFNSNLGQPLGKKLSLNANFRLQYLNIEGRAGATTLRNSGFFGNGNIGLAFRPTANLRITPSVIMNSSQPNLQGRTSGNIFSMMNIQQLFLQKKMNISLHVYNPLAKFFSANSTVTGADFIQQNTLSRVQRGVYMGVNYTFGQLKERVKKTKAVNNDDLVAPPREN